MLEDMIQEKIRGIDDQAKLLAGTNKDKKELAGNNVKLKKALKNLQHNYNRMKKAKKIAEDFKLEINTLQHKHNKIFVETGGTKRTLYGQ